MALLAIRVPEEVREQFASLWAPGEHEAPEHYHISLLYLGDDYPVGELARALQATLNVTQMSPKVHVRCTHVDQFRNAEHDIPTICVVESPELKELQAKLAAEFDQLGVTYSKKFPVYRPHVTLSYSDEMVPRKKLEKPIEWIVDEVVLWGGDEYDDRVSMNFPLDYRSHAFVQEYLELKKVFETMSDKLSLIENLCIEALLIDGIDADEAYCIHDAVKQGEHTFTEAVDFVTDIIAEKKCKGSKKAPVGSPRQRSFCRRMCGHKKQNTGADTASDPDSCIRQALRRWKCRCS